MTDTKALAMSRSLAAMIDGYLTTQLLYIAARLDLADRLAAGARSSPDLAHETGFDALAMHRLLRGLAAEGVLEEQPGAAFALTDLGEPLSMDHPQSQRGAILARGGL